MGQSMGGRQMQGRRIDAGFRVGFGYDMHRLAPRMGHAAEIGRPMMIGGIEFKHQLGPVAHSDGDALLHAITDAILGAAGLPDIGQLFPDNDPRWAGAKSEGFVAEAVRRAGERNWVVGNIDATVVVEAPKIGPRKQEIQESIARIVGVGPDCVNVKGKTHERASKTGLDDKIEAMAVVLLVRVDEAAAGDQD